ncbi:hypothetical protein [Paenibacillus montanisoli]|uniref:Uncharacterized protein n=1 Tax=Paenibacillus montanisoli TaxID=2081970 RepID=A0A328U608_9BACL|nr:hypothetical protein [Paenibacillus montanisoli]RAP77193.1 hypothetical protein DL346_01445 [Paenibacillus montanisoli]
MPISLFIETNSTAFNVFTRNTRSDAVAAAIANVGMTQTIAPGNVLNVWPQIRSYDSGDGPFFQVPFVWGETNFIPGQKLGFAAVISSSSAGFVGNFAYALNTFADNAHTVFLEAYEVVGGVLNPIPFQYLNATAGNMDPNTPLESQPYNWQFIRTSNNPIEAGLPGEDTVSFLVLSYEVQNYSTPLFTNPGGLSFHIVLFKET